MPRTRKQKYTMDEIEDAVAELNDLVSTRRESEQCPLLGYVITNWRRDINGNSRFTVRLYGFNSDTHEIEDVTEAVATVANVRPTDNGIAFQSSADQIIAHLNYLTDNIVYYAIT